MRRSAWVSTIVALPFFCSCQTASLNISGVVIEQNDIHGDRVSDALVMIGDFDGDVSRETIREIETLRETRTDEDGRFEFSSLSPGRYDLLIVKDGYFLHQDSVRLRDEDKDLELEAVAFEWNIQPRTAQLDDFIESATPGYGYEPDDGYQWLIVGLSVENLSRKSASFSSLFDRIAVIDSDGLEYSRRLQLNSIPGELPESYNPKQTQTGNVFFEVPIGFEIERSRLLVNLENGPDGSLFFLPNTY